MYILGDIVYVGAFTVCATHILEISDYVGAFSVCATYILEISDYVGAFSVCATYILEISDYVGVFIVFVTYISLAECGSRPSVYLRYISTKRDYVLCYVYLGERSLFTLALSAHVGTF